MKNKPKTNTAVNVRNCTFDGRATGVTLNEVTATTIQELANAAAENARAIRAIAELAKGTAPNSMLHVGTKE